MIQVGDPDGTREGAKLIGTELGEREGSGLSVGVVPGGTGVGAAEEPDRDGGLLGEGDGGRTFGWNNTCWS